LKTNQQYDQEQTINESHGLSYMCTKKKICVRFKQNNMKGNKVKVSITFTISILDVVVIKGHSPLNKVTNLAQSFMSDSIKFNG